MRTELRRPPQGIATVHGSAFECRVLAETCSLLYLNPPYDSEFGPHSNKRMELVFLEHCYRWVTSEGVLVFVVPAPAVGTCARLLASQFDRLLRLSTRTSGVCPLQPGRGVWQTKESASARGA